MYGRGRVPFVSMGPPNGGEDRRAICIGGNKISTKSHCNQTIPRQSHPPKLTLLRSKISARPECCALIGHRSKYHGAPSAIIAPISRAPQLATQPLQNRAPFLSERNRHRVASTCPLPTPCSSVSRNSQREFRTSEREISADLKSGPSPRLSMDGSSPIPQVGSCGLGARPARLQGVSDFYELDSLG